VREFLRGFSRKRIAAYGSFPLSTIFSAGISAGIFRGRRVRLQFLFFVICFANSYLRQKPRFARPGKIFVASSAKSGNGLGSRSGYFSSNPLIQRRQFSSGSGAPSVLSLPGATWIAYSSNGRRRPTNSVAPIWTGRLDPSVETLAAGAGVVERTVQTALRHRAGRVG
jgi:hypothetical protein